MTLSLLHISTMHGDADDDDRDVDDEDHDVYGDDHDTDAPYGDDH